MLSTSNRASVFMPSPGFPAGYPGAPGTAVMQDATPNAAPEGEAGRESSARSPVEALSGSELGMAVAREVMRWHSDHEQFTDCWVTEEGKLTGYYYGRPFSPYRDRNALAEVWKRLDALGLRARYMECLESVLGAATLEDRPVDAWSLHTCNPEIACRAAVLAVRTSR
jgi:hypothetical protein